MHRSGPSRVIKFLYSPAPPPPTVWALKPPLQASCAYNHLCTSDLYSPVHNVMDECISLLGQVGGGWALEISSFLGPKWHSPIGSMPFHRAQKTLNFQGPTVTEWPPVACKLYLSGRQSHANCIWVAASRMQIVHAWPPVTCKFYSCCMWLHVAAMQVQFAYDWRPLGYNLYVTGRQSHANFVCASGQYSAKSPVFCKHAARTITWIKKWRGH